MQPSPARTDPDTLGDEPPRRRVPLDLVAGLVLFAIAAFFLLTAGEGTLDWVFPATLSYAAGAVGVVLVLKALLGFGDRIPALPPILRGKGIDVAVFIAIMVGFVLLIIPLGFWAASALMIFVAPVYLGPNRSWRSIGIAAGTALTVVVLAYLLLEYVFYVPFPRLRWLPF